MNSDSRAEPGNERRGEAIGRARSQVKSEPGLVDLDFHEQEDAIARQHYAFLLSEDEFDEAFGRFRERRLTGPTRRGAAQARSTPTTAAAAVSSKTRTGTSRTSPKIRATAGSSRGARSPGGSPSNR